MLLRLTPQSPEGQCILRWREHLIEHDKGGRAHLRRASSVLDAALQPAVHRLRRQLETIGQDTFSEEQLDRLSTACALIAHIKQPGHLSLPQAMSERAPGSDRNATSELRFRRLLDAEDIPILFSGLRRSLPLIDGHVCPVLLTRDVMFWGDKVKRTWVYDYRWADNG
jgi:CRISPR system Cascade subunit CasB